MTARLEPAASPDLRGHSGKVAPFLVTHKRGVWAYTLRHRSLALAEALERHGRASEPRALRCCRGGRKNPPTDHRGPWVNCRRRYCASCIGQRTKEARSISRERLREAFARGGAATFLTLNPALEERRGLRDRITKLLSDFSKIRNRRAWRHPDRGFQPHLGLLFALEVGGDHPMGHPHLHILLWGLDPIQVEAASEWLREAWCGLNPEADPRLQVLAQVETSAASIETLTLYVTKGTRVSLEWPPALLLAVVDELSSRRRHLVRCGLAKGRKRQFCCAA